MYYNKYLLIAASLFLFAGKINAQPDSAYWWNESVFYEVFVRSFYDSNGDGKGDLNGLIQKLDYLNDGDPNTTTDLGIEGIWLMPINPSPSYHGYDVTDYKGINPQYGDMQTFKQFLQAAHQRGIKVIIDFVMNHSSRQHPWFQQAAPNPGSPYRNYYRWSNTNPGYPGPWGQTVWHPYNSYYYFGMFWSGMPDLNYETTALKNEMFDITRYWLDTIGVDGFRLDAIKHLMEDGQIMEHAPATFTFLREFNSVYKGSNPDALAVGEVWSATNQVVPYTTGNKLDICFEFDLASAIISSVRNGDPLSLKNKMTQVNSSYRFLQYATFLTNHDQDRAFTQIGENFDKMKLAASIYLTLPGVPFMYYGEEVGMKGSGADENKRRPMQWTPGANAGFTTGTPWYPLFANYSTENVQVMQANQNSLWHWYRKFIAIREQEAPLRRGYYNGLGTTNSLIYGFARYTRTEMNLVFHNFGINPVTTVEASLQTSRLPAGTYYVTNVMTGANLGSVIINSSGGFASTVFQSPVEGRSTAVLRISDTPSSVENDTEQLLSGFTLHQNYPNPFNPSTIISFSIPEKGNVRLTVFDITGREVARLVDEEMNAGDHAVRFESGNLPGGVYIYRLQAAGNSLSAKMTLLK